MQHRTSGRSGGSVRPAARGRGAFARRGGQQILQLARAVSQAAADDITKPENIFVGDAVVDEEAILAAGHKAGAMQQLEMFGNVGLPQAGQIDQFGNGLFAIPKLMQNLKAGRICQCLEAVRYVPQQSG